MARFYDGKRLVEITMRDWDNRYNTPTLDWSNDFFEVGGLEYDEDIGAYLVEDVEYLIDAADDWMNGTGEFYGEECPDYIEHQVFVEEV